MSLPLLQIDVPDQYRHRVQIATTVNELIKVRPPNDRTDAERTADVTPIDLNYSEGTFERYGAVGDGSTDDAAALANAALVAGQGVILRGLPNKTYRINSTVTMHNSFQLDGQGCTIKFAGGASFSRSPPSPDVTTTVSSGSTQGNVDVVVASATGLVVGDDVAIEVINYPRHWAKIKSITGTTIRIDRALAVTLTGTVNFYAFHSGTLRDRCIFDNVVFDGSLATSLSASSGQIARIGGYRDAKITNCRLKNYTTSGGAVLWQVYRCLDVVVSRNTSVDYQMDTSANVIDIQECRSAICRDNILHGSSFGINMTRCGQAVAVSNAMSGGLAYERAESIADLSIRGIKCTACADVVIASNTIADYANPIRIDQGFRFSITGNVCRNCSTSETYTGDIAISASSVNHAAQFGNVIANNVVEYTGGVAIGVDNGATNGDGRTAITGNVVRHCNGYGIYANDRDCLVSNNIIQDWDLVAGGRFGIYYSSGVTVIGNRFHHSTDTTRVCLRTFLDGGFKYVFRDNVAVDGNPMFAGPLDAETSGTATIASGSTTVVVTHGSIYTPTLPELTIIPGENATNDWGKWNIESIGATTFTIRVGVDPGASNLDIGWRFSPKFPRTA